MRATERLLEYIAMRAEFIQAHAGALSADEQRDEGSKLLDASTELRRRGDTLVRAGDLRYVIEVAGSHEMLMLLSDDEKAAFHRLENALGRRL